MRLKIAIALLVLLLPTSVAQKQPDGFDAVKHKIARYESANGRYKINVNPNRTVDCGLYQINSAHFVGKSRIARAYDLIFERFGVGQTLHERVVAAITNDALNEALAREMFRQRGISAWTSYRKLTTQQKDHK